MKSMTGMGSAQGELLGSPIKLEIKSVNHRFCEVNIRMPGKYSFLEMQITQKIKSMVKRGRVDLFLNEGKTSTLSPLEVKAFEDYHEYLNNIRRSLHLTDEVPLSLVVSGAYNWIQKEVNLEQAWKDLEPVLEKALNDLDGMRLKEGQALIQNLKDRAAALQNIKEQIFKIKDQINQELSEKLKTKIQEKLDEAQKKDLDETRLHTEVTYLLDRMDVTEELERLDSHLKQADEFLNSKAGPVGRKMDFLLQEFNREFNTIASKSQSASIAHLVVDAKAEIEKIREQIQNIE